MFEELPLEIVIEILAHVPGRHLKRAAQVCRQWHVVIPAAESRRQSEDTSLVDSKSEEELHQIFKSTIPVVENQGLSVWKRRAELYFPEWMTMLPADRDYRWLCLAADNFLSSRSERAAFSGLGRTIDIRRQVDDFEKEIVYEYVGEFVQGEFQGIGMIRSSDRDFDFYSGAWEHGLEHGLGKFSWNPRGKTFYLGRCRYGRRDGYGEYHWDSTRKYVGFHRLDQLWGPGVFTCKNAIIDGEWQANRQHGVCTIMWPPKEPSWKFIGTYQHGLRRGLGTYFWSDGAVYTGEWHGLNRQGLGKMEFSNGIIWEGTYERDLRHGQGTLTWTDTGDTFEGTWHRGGRQGAGVFTDGKTGEKTQQHWNEPSRIEYTNGASRWP